MEIKKPVVVGTLESSDVQITLRPNEGAGIQIELDSVVQVMFGDSIRETVAAVLLASGVEDAAVQINDKGALDQVIRARMQAAICRAAGCAYDWEKED